LVTLEPSPKRRLERDFKQEELAADRWANLKNQKLLVCVSVTFVTADDSGLSNQIAKEQTTNRIDLFFPRPAGFHQQEERVGKPTCPPQ